MQINRHLVIATRSSALALAQTQLVANAISSTISSSALLQLTTEGDKKLDTPLFESGGKGLFIKELEQALLDKKADLAVHSLKDMPLIGHPELINCYYLGQSSPLDVLVSQFSSLDELPYGATVGTSSIRRATQLKLLRNDLKIKLLRGNVLTRLEKLQEGNFDAIILAAAGLQRLNKLDPKYTPFSVQEMTPAFNQGIIAVQIRADDRELLQVLSGLSDPFLVERMKWERQIAQRFSASCESAFGVYAHVIALQPMTVELTVYACQSWDSWLRATAIHTNIDHALDWVEKTFFSKQIDWSVCQLSFF